MEQIQYNMKEDLCQCAKDKGLRGVAFLRLLFGFGLSETFAVGETRLAPAGALRRRKVVLRQSAGSLLELLALGGIAA